MNKISISYWYLGYLLLMGKLFMLLNNGESGKLTGIYLLVIITGIFFLICVDGIKMEGNKYIDGNTNFSGNKKKKVEIYLFYDINIFSICKVCQFYDNLLLGTT